MHFHTQLPAARPLEWPIALGHFLPWYTLRGDAYPLVPEDAAPLGGTPHIEDMRHWNDSRAGYRRTHLHLPRIGVYDSRDPAVIEWQIQTALRHGVSGFILNWYGIHSVENVLTLHWLRGLERWNRAHPEQPFVYCLSHDMQAQWPTEGKCPATLEEDFIYIRDHLVRDAYLRRDGRPLFTIFPYGDERETYRAVLDRVFGATGADLIWSGAPRGAGENGGYAWVKPDADTVQPGEPYCWSDPDNCGAQELRSFCDAANRAPSSEFYLMHGVWPEFNNTLVAWAWSKDPTHPHIRPSVICRETRSGSTLDRTWDVYLDYLRRQRKGDPTARVPAPLVQLVTWNDYAETTTLEPSQEYGEAPLERCRARLDEARAIMRAAPD
ncbi:MAG TPA: hypothetical protein PKE12_01720 [Kiritimatiellia bacterium]|nr:hypothetical protein [Kiritimatiellia bacterium]